MSDSLHVIALISGGKDSFFSLLHCLQHGHALVALANLHPAPDADDDDDDDDVVLAGPRELVSGREGDAGDVDGQPRDLNSFMYQTVGHTVVPLYADALGIPLYRQPIRGRARQMGTSYSHVGVLDGKGNEGEENGGGEEEDEEDETESLMPLLRRILADYPHANAVSTGAILSTYQRTRVESVALRLGLTPLSFLWKYPMLAPATQASLLRDMQHVGLEARLIKVASGGLDESFLWEDVACERTIGRMERSMRRFGMGENGAVLGEGGEFETLVLDGPSGLFKKKIVVEEAARRVVTEGGGSAWLHIREASVVTKKPDSSAEVACRVPDLLEPRFESIRRTLAALAEEKSSHQEEESPLAGQLDDSAAASSQWTLKLPGIRQSNDTMQYWSFASDSSPEATCIAEVATTVMEAIKQRLAESSMSATDIVSSVIILRSMEDFAAINKIYGSLFIYPNPPSRVTISCGELMPRQTDLIIHLKLSLPTSSLPARKALHVQSRSYWAPANIGPYSQAISIPLSSSISSVDIAGQIPLVPHTMLLPSPDSFPLQATLSLQHLVRVAAEMSVGWFAAACAFLPASSSLSLSRSRARTIGRAWTLLFAPAPESSDSEDEERDLWDEKHLPGHSLHQSSRTSCPLPDWDVVADQTAKPPVWIAEVSELPRGSAVEWQGHLGLCTTLPSSIALSNTAFESLALHTLTLGPLTHHTLLVPFASPALMLASLTSALSALNLQSSISCASYLDVSFLASCTAAMLIGGCIPCRSLWDGEGQRLGAVLIFEVIEVVS